MLRKTRMWVGMTLFAVLAINYAIIGAPLFKKSASIEGRYKAAMIKQLKSGVTEDEYLLDMFRRERSVLARRILVLNAAALSIFVIMASWTAFGLVHKEKK